MPLALLDSSEPSRRPVPGPTCKLPLFRPVGARILQALTDSAHDSSALVPAIRLDPSLVTELLVLANSPLYGQTASVYTPSEAVAVLGLNCTQALSGRVLEVALSNGMAGQSTARNCWSHSLSCALVAESLAPLSGMAADRAYTLGLLHDIGRLGLLASYPRQYGLLADATFATPLDALAAERHELGLDHCQAGIWLVRTWGLPHAFLDVAGVHAQPAVGSLDSLITLAQMACGIADALGFPAFGCDHPAHGGGVLPMLPEPVRERLRDERMRERICAILASFSS